METDLRDLIAIKDAAAATGLSVVTLQGQARKGRIAGQKVGRDWRLSRSSLDAYMASDRRTRPWQARRKGGDADVSPTPGRSETL